MPSGTFIIADIDVLERFSAHLLKFFEHTSTVKLVVVAPICHELERGSKQSEVQARAMATIRQLVQSGRAIKADGSMATSNASGGYFDVALRDAERSAPVAVGAVPTSAQRLRDLRTVLERFVNLVAEAPAPASASASCAVFMTLANELADRVAGRVIMGSEHVAAFLKLSGNSVGASAMLAELPLRSLPTKKAKYRDNDDDDDDGDDGDDIAVDIGSGLNKRVKRE